MPIRIQVRRCDDNPLPQLFRWEIVFHYQDRDQPRIVNIFREDVFRSIVGKAVPRDAPLSELHRAALAQRRPGEGLLELGERLWRGYIAHSICEVTLTESQIRADRLSVAANRSPFWGLMEDDGAEARLISDAGIVLNVPAVADGQQHVLDADLGGYYASVEARPGDKLRIEPLDDKPLRRASSSRPRSGST